jgi:hypothetical protein
LTVVVLEPWLQSLGSFVVGGEDLPVGPFGLEGPVESFDLAVLRTAVVFEARITSPVFSFRNANYWVTPIWTTNQPPVADANGPYTVDEGSPVTLDGSGSTDPDGDALTYDWDLDNDGEYDDATGVTTSWTYPDGPAIETVGLRVTDFFGEADVDTAIVTVDNVAPTLEPITVAPTLVMVGGSVEASAGFTDPGIADTHTAV